MKPVHAAIVGCGRISDLHALGYTERPDAVIAGVYDQDKNRARQKARQWGEAKVYPTYEQLLDDPEIDLVELLVPHHLHAQMTVQACKAGKHVSVQKPMALCVEEADEMIEAAQKAGVVLRVYENFVFYPPNVRAKEMIDAGEIGTPQMIRMHVGTGTQKTAWKVPLSAWMWRFDEKKCGGGPLVFDHGYHLFSLARWLMGEVERVVAWIDQSPVFPAQKLDAPAVIQFQFKTPRCYGVLDFTHTPDMVIESDYYADDDRMEIIGERGILFINRCTARTVDLPELMLFRDGKTTSVPVERTDWESSFIDCTRHLLDVLQGGGTPRLDGQTGKSVLQFALAAHISAAEGKAVRPDDVGQV